MKNRTIAELARKRGRVYVYLANSSLCDMFMQQAEQEGFVFADGAKPTEREAHEIMVIHSDFTLNYVGFAGHMLFGNNPKNLLRVDYAKYRNGLKDYLYRDNTKNVSAKRKALFAKGRRL